MRTEVAAIRQAEEFERILEALAEELIASTDEELVEAARDLGMNPTMRGSAAFIGLKYPAMPRLSDFFDVPSVSPERVEAARSGAALPRSRPRLSGKKKRRRPPGRGTRSDAE